MSQIELFYCWLRQELIVLLDSLYMSPKLLALALIIAGILIVFAISGFQIVKLFSPSITEQVTVTLKQNGACIVEASDNIPRQIHNCPYEIGQDVTINYKAEQPSIESHGLP